MDEPPGGQPRAVTGEVPRFSDEETIAARLAPAPAWAVIVVGIGCVLFAGLFFAGKYSGHNVAATVTRQACTDVCTVQVAYNAGGSQVTAVMHGVPLGEIYGPPSHQLLNINYGTGAETDPTPNDMPDGTWIGFLAAGLAFTGWGIWWRRWQKAYAQKLSMVPAGGAPAGGAIADAAAAAAGNQPGLGGLARIAERDPRWMAVLSSVLLAPLPGLFLANAHATVPVTIGGGVLAAGLGMWGVVRAWRIALVADAGSLTVRNHLRTYRLNWHQVAQFRDGRISAGEAGTLWALRIVLNDGRAITAQATARKIARPSTAETIVEIARQHGIPESLTGRPPSLKIRLRRPRG